MACHQRGQKTVPDSFDRLKTALADRYAIEREIGAGGMATVYLAEDLKHHRKVAVKVLRPDLAAALGPERFLREIEVAAQLHHPHILPLYDSGEADGFLYYVMPYEEGQSLREKLAKEGELPVTEAVRLLRDVVDALAHAHKHGVVHRDIKPDNVMLSDRHALVTDFGVAKAVTEATGRQQLTTAGVALGTPAYMAPEQAVADPHIDHRADIYAVGALAYELLTGRPPFTGTTPQMILSAHVTEAPELVTKHRTAVPPALASLVMKCLEKKPADRWQTAEELLIHLEALATPSGGVTPTDTRPVAAVGAPQRKTLVGAGALLGALVVAAVGWWLLASRGGAVGDQPSGGIWIAVLPFENLSANAEDEYYSDGITRDINAQLAKIGGFIVIAHGSARRSSSGEKSYRELADELGVDYLVDGSVRRTDGRVHINASLIDPATGGQLWSDVYDHEESVAEIVHSEGELAQQVATALGVTVAPEEQAKLAAEPTENTEAYNAYQLGRFFWNTRTVEGLRRAVDQFDAAIAADSGYALAYTGLADAYALFPFYAVTDLSRREAYARAEQAARRAVELDSNLAEGRASLAYILEFGSWDWEGAEQEFRRGVALDPDYAVVRYWYSEYLGLVGRTDEGIAHASRAIALDPLALFGRTILGWLLQSAGDAEGAAVQFRKAIAVDSTYQLPHASLAIQYLTRGGMRADAVTELELAGLPRNVAGAIADAVADSSRREAALALMLEHEKGAPVFEHDPAAFARLYSLIGLKDTAFTRLEAGYRARSEATVYLRLDPAFDNLRSDPRYRDLLRRMGLE